MDREKVIAKFEKEVKKTYSIKTTIYNNGKKVNEDITEHREPGIKISMEMADEILAMLKEQAKTKVVFGRTKDGEFVTECGNCGTHLDKAYSNCPKCKKELDWNSNQT